MPKHAGVKHNRDAETEKSSELVGAGRRATASAFDTCAWALAPFKGQVSTYDARAWDAVPKSACTYAVPEEDDCAICLAGLYCLEFVGAAKLDGCSHAFHVRCLAPLTRQTCPLCRSEFTGFKLVSVPRNFWNDRAAEALKSSGANLDLSIVFVAEGYVPLYVAVPSFWTVAQLAVHASALSGIPQMNLALSADGTSLASDGDLRHYDLAPGQQIDLARTNSARATLAKP